MSLFSGKSVTEPESIPGASSTVSMTVLRPFPARCATGAVLVLAGENFNETSPFGNQGTRVPFVDDNGKLFYSGAHAGIEYTW